MHVQRGFLFWGLFLLPLGAIPLLVRAGALDVSSIGDAWRLWPLVLIAVGLAILIGRTRASLVGTALVAILLGSLAGTALAAGPQWISAGADCGLRTGTTEQLDRTGTFGGPATLRLDLRCGNVALTTQAGSDWRLRGTHDGPAPRIDANATGLTIVAPRGSDVRHQDWIVTAPSDRLEAVEVTANAAGATFHLDGAHLARLWAELNAGDILIDAGSATIDRLDVTMNAGRARIVFGPGGPVTGQVSVNAGVIDLCVPAGSALRIATEDQLTFITNLAQRGLTREGGAWQRAGTNGAPLIDLSIKGNAAALNLDPDGGCK